MVCRKEEGKGKKGRVGFIYARPLSIVIKIGGRRRGGASICTISTPKRPTELKKDGRRLTLRCDAKEALKIAST